MSDITLITGGLGYLGGRLANELRHTRRVRLLTRRPKEQYPEWTRGLDVVTCDILDEQGLRQVSRGVSDIVHLAALNAQACAANPIAAIEVNIKGAQKLIRAAQEAGVARMLYMSTGHVYGRPVVGRITEETLPRPAVPYSWTHRAAEDIVLAAAGVETCVFRLSNMISAPADPMADCWMLVANDLCRQAVERGHLTLRGTGLEERDVIAAKDVARAVDHLLHLPQRALGDRIFNLGGQRSVTMRALANLIAERAGVILGSKPGVTYKPGNEPSPPLIYEIEKLLATGFQLTGNLEMEVDETLALCLKWWGKN